MLLFGVCFVLYFKRTKLTHLVVYRLSLEQTRNIIAETLCFLSIFLCPPREKVNVERKKARLFPKKIPKHFGRTSFVSIRFLVSPHFFSTRNISYRLGMCKQYFT